MPAPDNPTSGPPAVDPSMGEDPTREVITPAPAPAPVADMRGPGQICRNLTCKKFKIAIVLGPSRRSGKLCVCHWVPSDEPFGGHWSSPHAVSESLLDPLAPDFDLTSHRGQVVAAAKRSIINGLVRWQKNPRFHGDKLIEVHCVGTVRP